MIHGAGIYMYIYIYVCVQSYCACLFAPLACAIATDLTLAPCREESKFFTVCLGAAVVTSCRAVLCINHVIQLFFGGEADGR